jgi:hypothetical protein
MEGMRQTPLLCGKRIEVTLNTVIDPTITSRGQSGQGLSASSGLMGSQEPEVQAFNPIGSAADILASAHKPKHSSSSPGANRLLCRRC